MSSEIRKEISKCPFHGEGIPQKHPTGKGQTNKDWWPNSLNLSYLATNPYWFDLFQLDVFEEFLLHDMDICLFRFLFHCSFDYPLFNFTLNIFLLCNDSKQVVK